MPTILDTLNVQMCTISYGKEASFAGKLASVTITVTPMAAGIGPIRLNWAATGDIFSPFSDTTSGDTGAPGIIALPRTDQDGFRHGTTPFKNWYYKAAVVATLADGQQLARSYQFQTASPTLDLDLLDEDSVVTALPVIVGPGTEPAGLSDATRTALSATYPTLDGSSRLAIGGTQLVPKQIGAPSVALSKTGTFIPSDWGQFWKPKRDLAKAGSGKAVVAVDGDSISQLFDASTYPNSWVGRMRASLQSLAGTADGGSGFIGIANSGKVANSGAGYGNNSMFPCVLTGTWAVFQGNLGPGIVSYFSATTGDTAVFTVRGSTIKIFSNSNTTGGTWTYSVDGAAAQTVTHPTAFGVLTTTITGLTSGSHVVTITVGNTGKNLAFYGVAGENAAGIVVNNFSLQATTTGNWANTGSPAPGQWNGGSSYPCDLLIYALGVNDSHAVTGYATTADAYIDNINTVIAQVKNGQLGATDVLFYLPHLGQWQTTGPAYYQMTQRLRGYAESQGAAFVNGWALMRNSYAYATSLGYWGDSSSPGAAGPEPIHPSDAGHAIIAGHITPHVLAA